MTRKNRTVAKRHQSLQPDPPPKNFTIAGARRMYGGVGGREYSCTISEYCRTQIFEFPRIDFQPNGEEPHHNIYASPSVEASLATNLVDYFSHSTFSKHYDISPVLRHAVCNTDEIVKSQLNGRVPVYLVIEECNQLTPVHMVKGECSITDEIVVENGENIPMLSGGREGEQFIIATPTINGAWPEMPSNELLVNMVLAGVRVGQQTSDPIRKYSDQSCLVTDDGRFVVIMQPTMSARASTVTPMGPAAYRHKASEIRKALLALEKDISAPHIALLLKAMYRDEYEDDAYQRLQYLRLWESLAEAGPTFLNYQGSNIKSDPVVIAGNKTLKQLAVYRHKIAHWWTDTIDEAFLANLQRTINELMRRKYF